MAIRLGRSVVTGLAFATLGLACLMFIQDALIWYLEIFSERSFHWLRDTSMSFDAFHQRVQAAIPYALCMVLGVGGVVGFRSALIHRQVLSRFAVLPVSVAAGVSASTISPRLIGLGVLPLPLILQVLFLSDVVRLRVAAITWVLAVSVFLSPVDMSFRQYPGGPRFVPVVAGVIGVSVFEAGARGELYPVLCPSFEPPKRLWVW